jgi:hypothetical protein
VSRDHFPDHFFGVVKLFEIFYSTRAFPITAFVGSDLFLLFPPVKSVAAVRAIIIGRIRFFPESFVNREGVVTYFAFELRTLFAVVVIDILMRSLTMRTADNIGHEPFFGSCVNQLKRLIMFFPVSL